MGTVACFFVRLLVFVSEVDLKVWQTPPGPVEKDHWVRGPPASLSVKCGLETRSSPCDNRRAVEREWEW